VASRSSWTGFTDRNVQDGRSVVAGAAGRGRPGSLFCFLFALPGGILGALRRLAAVEKSLKKGLLDAI
jgi:hypothetical protein